MIEKFKKKPVIIEAALLENTPESLKTIFVFMESNPPELSKDNDGLIIHTLEGDHLARFGDWIIKGVHGEFYPCKPDIFEKTYSKI